MCEAVCYYLIAITIYGTELDVVCGEFYQKPVGMEDDHLWVEC